MFSKVLLILSLTSVVFGTVFVTNPTAKTTYSGGKPATVSWEDNGIAPSLKDFGNAKISIYAGNSQQQTSLQLLNASVDVSASSSITFTPDATIGPNSSNYFIRFESLTIVDTSVSKTTALAFSALFTLDNMTGTFSAAVQAQIAGQSTAPLAGQSSTSTTGPTSIPSITTTTASKKPTSATSATPSATKTSAAMGVKAGWASVAFGAFVGLTMF